MPNTVEIIMIQTIPLGKIITKSVVGSKTRLLAVTILYWRSSI